MSDPWLYSIASVALVSIISLIGVFTISVKEKDLERLLLYMVSFAAGALFGDAFIHLLPEAVAETGFTLEVSGLILLGIVFSFIAEKIIRWRHCHIPTTEKHPHPFAVMNLVGDGVHNFIDGLIIGGSYLASVPVGIATTIAVVLHEIPQEIGDFGVLVKGGFSRGKALFYNFLTALTAVLGAVVALLANAFVGNLTSFLVPFAAGAFIYIAGSDLIPELHKEVKAGKSALQLAAFLLGIAMMLSLTALE
ncbi:MAG TPA: ZIP family metal transporter [archaeon]|nr:ZIP family metal transporter [archaeon]